MPGALDDPGCSHTVLRFLSPYLDDRLLSNFRQEYPDFQRLTKVQEKCIPEFLAKKDVIVEAPTGSGKTLAFALPTLHFLLARQEAWKKWEIGAVVVLPNRELAVQVKGVFEKLTPNLPLTLLLWSGGKPLSKDVENFKQHGGNIVIATPGRLEALLSDSSGNFCLAGHLKSVEVLILDEADRLLEIGFQESLRIILSSLPKQRRTGLFSATQVDDMEELLRTGLRNPSKITVKASEDPSLNLSTPSSLKNYYRIISADKKLAGLAQFLRSHRKSKILVFFSTCACVDYFSRVLRGCCLPSRQELLVLHGKKKRGQRQKIFDRFRAMKRGVMTCTDVMARGIDIPDIDWVVQYDPPRQATWFVHRAGRTGRCERAGRGLALLCPSEEDYIHFLQGFPTNYVTFAGRLASLKSPTNQRVEIEELPEWREPSEELAEGMRERVRDMAAADRDFLERGSRAFVSYIQAYSKHDCHIVCPLDELDVCGTGHSFGLLRLPRMPELSRRDLRAFRRSDIPTADIKFKDKRREADRQALLSQRAKGQKTKKGEHPIQTVISPLKQNRKRSGALSVEEAEELEDDTRLLKKLKKGKISKEEFDKVFLDL